MNARTLAVIFVAIAVAGCYPVIGGTLASGAAVGAVVGGVTANAIDKSNTRGPNSGASVAITFVHNRDVRVVGRSHPDTSTLRGVYSIVGRLRVQRGDTMLITVSEVNGPTGRALFPTAPNSDAIIVREKDVNVRILNSHPSRTHGIVLGAIIGFAAAVGAIFIECSVKRCFD